MRLSSFLAAGGAVLLAAIAVLVFRSPQQETVRSRYVFKAERKAEYSREAQEWNRRRFADPKTGEIPLDAKGHEARLAASFRAAAKRIGASSEAVWIARGPFHVGGRTRAVAIDVAAESVVIAASVSGGIWRSEDEGATWQKALHPDQIQNVVSLAQDTRAGRTDVWYAGTGELIGSGHSVGNGVYKSIDGGRSWDLLPATQGRPEFAFVSYVEIDPSNLTQDEVYAATDTGVYRTVDGGATWTPVLTRGNRFTVAVAANGAVYAARGHGYDGQKAALFRSPDGITFTDITPQRWPETVNDTEIATAASNPQIAHFFTEGFDYDKHLWTYEYVSGNGSGAGGNWVDRSDQLPSYLGTYTGYTSALAVHPEDEEDIFVGGQILTRFSPNADRFHGYGIDVHADHHDLAFLPSDPNVIYAATDGGIYRQDNQMEPFRSLNDGFVTTQFYGVGINPSAPGEDAVVGGTQDNWSYFAPSGAAAQTVQGSTYGSDGGFAHILPDGVHILVETHGGAVVRRNVVTGQEAQINPYDDDGSILFINPYAVDPASGYAMYYPIGGSLWRNHDVMGGRWERLNGTRLDEWAISAIGISTASPAHRVYYGTVLGKVARIDDAAGANPVAVDITPSSIELYSYVSSVSVDAENADHVLVTVSNYNVKSVYFSDNGGVSWQEVGGNLEGVGGQVPGFAGPAVTASGILPLHDGVRRYFVGTSMGLYSTTSLRGAATFWEQEASETIGVMQVDQIAVRASDGFVAAATHGAGLWSAYYTLPPPLPISPAMAANVTEEAPLLTWRAVPGAHTYEIQLSTDAAFTAPVSEIFMGDTAYIPIGLQPSTAYFWRLRSLNESRTSAWTRPWTFNSAAATTVEKLRPGLDYQLGPAAPNPFSSNTTISFTLDEAGRASLSVFDMNGRLVAVLVDALLPAGRHEVAWNADRAPAGTYVVRLESGGRTRSRLVALVR